MNSKADHEDNDAVAEEPANPNKTCVETSQLSGNKPKDITKKNEYKKTTSLNLSDPYENPVAGTSGPNSRPKSCLEPTQDPFYFKETLE